MQHKLASAMLIAAVAASLGGCAGIPLATMWHFRSFGPKDFLQVQPSKVRAAIELADGIELRNPPGHLNVTLKFGSQAPHEFQMPLKLVGEGASLPAGAGDAEPGKHWYLLALSPQGTAQFAALQDLLRQTIDAAGHFKQHGSFEIEVETGTMKFSDAQKARLKRTRRLFIRTRLRLLPNDAFYTLYDGELPYKPDTAKPGSN